MIMEQFMPVRYYWWAAVAFFGATIVLALAIRLREGYPPATR
jgi:preprotein translocase subunit SecG